MQENSFDLYLDELSHSKPLSDKEEKELSTRILNGDGKAVEQLTTANLRYVVTIARQYQHKGLDINDLVAEGNIGLMTAARKFDASKGIRFVNFAADFVRDSIEQAINRHSGLYQVPRNERTTVERKRSIPVSMDKPIGNKDNVNLLSILINKDAPEADEHVRQEILASDIERAMDGLNPREKTVISNYYGLGHEHMTMTEIAESTGLKRERVRQIRKQAERKIRKHAKHLLSER